MEKNHSPALFGKGGGKGGVGVIKKKGKVLENESRGNGGRGMYCFMKCLFHVESCKGWVAGLSLVGDNVGRL